MGDIVLTLPALRALKRRWPQAHLEFLTDARFVGLFDGVAAVDQVRGLDRVGLKTLRPTAVRGLLGDTLRTIVAGHWDQVIDLQGFGETAVITWLTRAPIRVGREHRTRTRWAYNRWVDNPHAATYMVDNHLDTLIQAGLLPPTALDTWAANRSGPWVAVTDPGRTQWARRSATLPHPLAEGETIALFVGAAKSEKRWPAEKFAQLATHLVSAFPDRKLSFLVFAGPGESEHVHRVLALLEAAGYGERAQNGGLGSLGALAAALQSCLATISNDTGPMHLSIAVGTPTLGIFRRSMPHFLPPAPHRHVVVPGGREIVDLSVEAVAAEARLLLG